MPTLRSLHARLAITSRYWGDSHPKTLDIRQQLNAAMAEKAVRDALGRTPTLSLGQRTHLASIVLGDTP